MRNFIILCPQLVSTKDKLHNIGVPYPRCYEKRGRTRMYRIVWFIEDAWDAVIYGALSVIAWLDNPKLWDNVKLLGLAVLTLFCAWGTVVVYNAPGTWREPIAGIAGVALFVLCTAQAFLMLIYYGHEQAKRDALMG